MVGAAGRRLDGRSPGLPRRGWEALRALGFTPQRPRSIEDSMNDEIFFLWPCQPENGDAYPAAKPFRGGVAANVLLPT